jgi:hypothetical protein
LTLEAPKSNQFGCWGDRKGPASAPPHLTHWVMDVDRPSRLLPSLHRPLLAISPKRRQCGLPAQRYQNCVRAHNAAWRSFRATMKSYCVGRYFKEPCSPHACRSISVASSHTNSSFLSFAHYFLRERVWIYDQHLVVNCSSGVDQDRRPSQVSGLLRGTIL